MRLFWKNIRTILERRRMRLQDKESGTDVKLPFMLVVVDAMTPAPGWSCLHDLEGEAAISTIMMDGQMLGAGIIFLVPERAKVPSRCLSVIEVDEDPMDEESVVFRYAETGFNSILYVGSTKLVSTQEKAREFSRNLEMVDVRRGYGSSLAATVTLMEMLNVTTMDQLQQMATGELAPQHGSQIRRLALHRRRPALGQRTARADLFSQGRWRARHHRRLDRFRQIRAADDHDHRHGAQLQPDRA